MLSKRPSSQFSKSSVSSRSSSRQSHSVRSWDADDESTMSMDVEEHHHHHNNNNNNSVVPSLGGSSSKSLSVTIPQAAGPYCPRRPNLREILANTSPPPWTLTAFMAYLSANLCLENLEFTMDAGRYGKHYAKMMSKAGEDGKPSAKDSEYVRLLWHRLIDAYIAPNGSREVNLPSNVRDPILTASTNPMPPPPETLDLAVRKTYELMEESVLVPFLNSCSESQLEVHSVAGFEDHQSASARLKRSRDSPPPTHHSSAAAGVASSSVKPRFGTKTSSSNPLTTSISNTSDYVAPGMTDDSGSTGSPTNDSPMTPPMSPPTSDMHHTLSSSPKHGRDSGVWKRLGRLSGMKVGKKRSGGFSEDL